MGEGEDEALGKCAVGEALGLALALAAQLSLAAVEALGAGEEEGLADALARLGERVPGAGVGLADWQSDAREVGVAPV